MHKNTLDPDAKARLQRADEIASNQLQRVNFAIERVLEDLGPADQARKVSLRYRLRSLLRRRIRARKRREAAPNRRRVVIPADAYGRDLYHKKRIPDDD